MDYMLDTNVCIAIMKGHSGLWSRLSEVSPDDIGISSIVLAVLSYGVSKSAHRTQNQLALADFCSVCRLLDWPYAAADTYGEIRTFLEKRGCIIGANDLLIASHVKYLNATLVTNNLREFTRVPGLAVEDWISH